MSYAPFDLGGKCALVTGGNGGIGLGMADALAQAGQMSVYGYGRGEEFRGGNPSGRPWNADQGDDLRHF